MSHYALQEHAGAMLRLRWRDTPADAGALSLLAAHEEATKVRDMLLSRLAIQRRDGESHLKAWVRTMAEENQVPVEVIQAHIRSSVQGLGADTSLARFIWVLA